MIIRWNINEYPRRWSYYKQIHKSHDMICDLKTHYTLISIEMLDTFSTFSLFHAVFFFGLLLPFFALENCKELQTLSMACVRFFCFIRFIRLLYYGPYYSLSYSFTSKCRFLCYCVSFVLIVLHGKSVHRISRRKRSTPSSFYAIRFDYYEQIFFYYNAELWIYFFKKHSLIIFGSLKSSLHLIFRRNEM